VLIQHLQDAKRFGASKHSNAATAAGTLLGAFTAHFQLLL
jgi:uncharacterized protein YqgC (DUF456 family)